MKKRSRFIPDHVRRAVLERDGDKCRDCGATRRLVNPHMHSPVTNLQLHHIVEFENGGEHTVENLITLCTKCHRKRDQEHVNVAIIKAQADKRAALAAEGYICISDAARTLGISPNCLLTRVFNNNIKRHTHPSYDRYVLIRLDDLEILKVRDRAA